MNHEGCIHGARCDAKAYGLAVDGYSDAVSPARKAPPGVQSLRSALHATHTALWSARQSGRCHCALIAALAALVEAHRVAEGQA